MTTQETVEYGDPDVAGRTRSCDRLSAPVGTASQSLIPTTTTSWVSTYEVAQAEVSARISTLEEKITAILANGRTPLPERPHVEKISASSIDAQSPLGLEVAR